MPYHGLSVNSVIVTKRGPLGSGGLYKTSRTMGQGAAKLHSYTYTKRTDILIYLCTEYTNILIYSVITIGRSYIFKHTVPTVK